MKRKLLLVGILCTFMLSLLPMQTSAEDISKHWAYTEMSDLINKGILKGDATGGYRPNEAVNRAEFTAFLVRALHVPEVTTTSNFLDVSKGDWYYDVVQQASAYQLIKGDDKGNFNPKNNINRQEMASMLKRALDYLKLDTPSTSLTFQDTDLIAVWATADVKTVVSLGLIVGKPNNTFAPLANATRAEAATVLYRLLHLDSKKDPEPDTDIDQDLENDNVVEDDPVVDDEGSNNPETEVSGKQYTTTTYPIDYTTVLYKQAANSPKVDGAGIFTASDALVSYYLHPNSFAKDSPSYYQFLKLSTAVHNLNATLINENVLHNKGSLIGTAEAFIQAGLQYDMNAIYLLSHALHETGNGASALSTGLEVGLDAKGSPVLVTTENRAQLTDIKKTYNVYGIGAIDANANKYGAERAYTNGWFTIEDAIIGGAQFVKQNYIGSGQDTLYKMRWNPAKPATHQYATHVMWAVLQAKKIADLYDITGANETTLQIFEMPVYLSQPIATSLPSPENQYAIDPALAAATGESTINLNMRTYPNTTVASSIITTLPKGTTFTILGANGGWYKVNVNGKIGWVFDDYVYLPHGLQVIDMKTPLNVRTEPNTTSTIIGNVSPKGYVLGVVDEKGAFVKEGNWYKVRFNEKIGWVHGAYIVTPSAPLLEDELDSLSE